MPSFFNLVIYGALGYLIWTKVIKPEQKAKIKSTTMGYISKLKRNPKRIKRIKRRKK